MLQHWMSLMTAIIVLVAVYHAYPKNSDSAKKFVLIVVIGVFLLEAGQQVLAILGTGVSRYGIAPLVDSIVVSLLFVFLLNHRKKAHWALYIMMVTYFVIYLYEMSLFY